MIPMMLLRLIHGVPFRRFSIHFADGENFEVESPDRIAVSKNGLMLLVDDELTVTSRMIYCSFPNVIRIEQPLPGKNRIEGMN